MYRLLEFLKNIYVPLLFILLECGAILYYVNANSYRHARVTGAVAWVSNGFNSTIGSVRGYFRLKGENEALVLQIAKLDRELSMYRNHYIDSMLMVMSDVEDIEEVRIAARVVSNTINRRRNQIIINRGVSSGVHEKMAVVTPEREMVGVVMSSYDNYAVVMPVLNTDFKSSGRLINSDHAGSIYWDSKDRYTLRMSFLSKYAEPFDGAEVVTTNFSSIFPEGVKIGTVRSFNLNNDQTTYELEIEIAAEMSALDKVLVVGSRELNEVEYINEMLNDKSLE